MNTQNIGLIHHDPEPDSIFTPCKDGLNHKYIALREKFRNFGFDLCADSPDHHNKYIAEIHLNVIPKNKECPTLLLAFEPDSVYPLNHNQRLVSEYDAVISWDSFFSFHPNFLHLHIPHRLGCYKFTVFSDRDIFSSLINSNKGLQTLALKSDGYLIRQKIISFYNKYYPDWFDLYGHRWNLSFKLPTKLGSAIHSLESRLLAPAKSTLTVFKGIASTKRDVLSSSKFSFVIENSLQNDYISEKIFDSFEYGCVPVYLGATNISSYIPRGCFINLNDFASLESLHRYLSSVDPDIYCLYQKNIRTYLNIEAKSFFDIDTFGDKIVSITSLLVS